MANILKKKLGPLPVWAWALIAVGLLVGYKLFAGGGSKSAQSAGGYTTDEYGNVYDANGNLVSAAPYSPAGSVSQGSSIGSGGGSGVTPVPPVDNGPGNSGYNQGYIDALEAASGAFASGFGTPATTPAPGPESPAQPALDVGALLEGIFGGLASPSVVGAATPVAAPPTPGISSPTSGGALPRYYTYKSQVPLGPGQTLHFTPGRGYYAWAQGAPAPAPPIVAPHVAPNPPSVVLAHPSPPSPRPVPTTHRYYTYKSQVPLGPGQTIHFTPGRGYYAA